MLILEHEGVDGVSLIQDDAGGPHFCIVDGVCHVVIAGKNAPIILQCLQPHLQSERNVDL